MAKRQIKSVVEFSQAAMETGFTGKEAFQYQTGSSREFPKLWGKCPCCDGKGYTQENKALLRGDVQIEDFIPSGQDSYGKIVRPIDGNSFNIVPGEKILCPVCNGHGWLLSPLGLHVLETLDKVQAGELVATAEQVEKENKEFRDLVASRQELHKKLTEAADEFAEKKTKANQTLLQALKEKVGL